MNNSRPRSRAIGLITLVMFGLLTSMIIPSISLAQNIVPGQIQAAQNEKNSRTREERKLDSQLLFLSRETAGRRAVEGAPNMTSRVKRETDGRVAVEISAAPSAALRQAITAAGGTVTYESPRWNSVSASVPPAALMGLATRADVKRINRAAAAFTHTGTVDNEADPAHRADVARTTYGVNGSGITVGVLSDSANHSAQSIASGDLPADFASLPGQDGGSSGGEGTAMSEIVYDIAPGAKILFATAFGGAASYADNIIALRAAGAQIIVDDVSVGDEWQFQDDIIGQAVNQVVADGALYFSAAGNEGSLRNGNATVWEGDFVDGGANALIPGGTVHSFGAQPYDSVVNDTGGVELQWSDEYNSSANDYDLYVLNAAGTAIQTSSTNIQDGTPGNAPIEDVGAVHAGERIVIFKAASAAPRYLRILSHGSVLTIGTPGEIIGHSSTGSAIGVAGANSTDAVNTAPGYFTTATQGDNYSSDGPRKMFYQPNGTPFTPGNVLASGGVTLQQPILTAGDCGVTTVPGFAPFCGTSASAPAAAAITALVWSSNLSRTNTQVRALLLAGLLDIQDPGFDVNTGNGILRADLAVANAVPPSATPTNTPPPATPTNTPVPPTATNTPVTATATRTSTPTNTPMITPSRTSTPTKTPSPTKTATPTKTPSPTKTATPTKTPSPTTTPTPPPTAGFPSTSVLDTFNRPDGNVGSNWTGANEKYFYSINDHKLNAQWGGPLIWKAATFGTSQEAYVTLSTIDKHSPSQGLLLKVQSGSMDGGGITVVYDAVSKAVRVSALRLNASSWTIYPSTSVTFAKGDVLGARALSNGKVEIYKNGTKIATVTLNAADQAFFNSKGGKIGIWSIAADDAEFDNFGGGTLPN